MNKRKATEYWDREYFYQRTNPPSYDGTRLYSEAGNISGVVLDVGCGTFSFLSLDVEKQENNLLVGLDFSREALEIAKRKNVKFRKNVDFVLGDAQRLPFKEETFNNLLSIETVSHTGPHYYETLEEFKRVCDGKFFLTFYHKDRAKKQGITVKKDLAKYEKEGTKYLAVFDESNVLGLLGKLGFDIEKMKTYTTEELGISKKEKISEETKSVIYVECEKN